MFEKILVANRGEIALRIFRACRELGIGTVAIYSEADENSLHRERADEAACVGPARVVESYLNMDKILEIAREYECDALHPGYGFLAENAGFARKVVESDLVWIGPSPQVLETAGAKVEARQAAGKAGVPLISGSPPIQTLEEAQEEAEKIGYPVMIKAALGGGGLGMNRVESAHELAKAFKKSTRRAKAAFGDPTLYMETALSAPRHIEVQILFDNDQRGIHLFERECSIQRRYQKLVEEAPAPNLGEDLRQNLFDAALSLARELKYNSAGTVEFLVDGEEFYFLEINPRIQVEHPVTEMVTGRDIVAEQIRIAAGEKLRWSQEEIEMSGSAIECRIYAEDPAKNFRPSPGKIEKLDLPQGEGIRHECGVKEGSEVTVYYDPLLAKLVVWGKSREEALHRLKKALAEYEIEGIGTTLPFFRKLVHDDHFQRGQVTTNFTLKI